MSVVDSRLSVRGVEGLSIADALVMPRIHGKYDGADRHHWRTNGELTAGLTL